MKNTPNSSIRRQVPGKTRPWVLMTSSSFPRWAHDDVTGRFMLDIARSLLPSFRVLVLAPKTHGSKSLERMEGVLVIRYSQNPFGLELAYGDGMLGNISKNKFFLLVLPFLFFNQAFALIYFSRRLRVAYLNPHWILPQGILAVLCKIIARLRAKVIPTGHGSDLNRLSSFLPSYLKRITLRHSSHVIVVGTQLKSKVIELGYSGPLSIISMGVDVERFHPSQRDQIWSDTLGGGMIILYVGALIESKGLIPLMYAFASCIRKFPSAKLVFVGSGSLETHLQNLSQEWGIQSSVCFYGVVDHRKLPRLLASADLLVQPSYAEGFSLCVAEALACETPVLMTANTGISEVMERTTPQDPFLKTFQHEKSGNLEQALLWMLENPNHAKALAKRGRKFVSENYSLPVISDRYLTCFSEQ